MTTTTQPRRGRPPRLSTAEGKSALEFLKAVMADPKAPLTARVKAACEVNRIEERLAEERETRRIKAYNDRQLKEAGL